MSTSFVFVFVFCPGQGYLSHLYLYLYFVQDKDVYLIDDIFSAVDGHVAAHIYRKVTKLMKKMMTNPSREYTIFPGRSWTSQRKDSSSLHPSHKVS